MLVAHAALVVAAITSVAGATPVFQLGACYGWLNSVRMLNIITKMAFEQGFFDDIMPTTDFTFNIVQANTGCSGSGGSAVSLPLLMGEGMMDGRAAWWFGAHRPHCA